MNITDKAQILYLLERLCDQVDEMDSLEEVQEFLHRTRDRYEKTMTENNYEVPIIMIELTESSLKIAANKDEVNYLMDDPCFETLQYDINESCKLMAKSLHIAEYRMKHRAARYTVKLKGEDDGEREKDS